MNLKKRYNYFNLNDLDLSKDLKYEREIRREFYQEPSKYSARNSKGKERSLRASKWCGGIFNF